jgi:uncharacterized membrane protein YtjA (UPF0391 family)
VAPVLQWFQWFCGGRRQAVLGLRRRFVPAWLRIIVVSGYGTSVSKTDWFDSRGRARAAVVQTSSEIPTMLGWVVTFLVIALISGLLGFGGIAGASIEIAKIIFFIAIVLFLVSAVVHVSRGRRV